MACIACAAARLPQGAVMSLLRLLCNALNTTRMYRNKSTGGLISDCPWCGHLGGDEIWHICSCSKLRLAVGQRWLRIRLPDNRRDAAVFFCLTDRPGPAAALQRFLVADLIVKCFQAKLTNPTIVRKLDECIGARLVKWTLCRGAGYAEVWQQMM